MQNWKRRSFLQYSQERETTSNFPNGVHEELKIFLGRFYGESRGFL